MGAYDEITPKHTVNAVALAIIFGVIGASLLGLVTDHMFFRRRLKGIPDDRPRGWTMGLIIASYILLIPGLLHTLFGYRIAAVNGMQVLSERKENMVEFAHELLTSGSISGFLFVVGFAIVLPLLKMCLLITGGILRHSQNRDRRLFARRCILFVQRISKWASPDMFAYILLVYLIRGFNHPPILNGFMDLDIGFSCFATFCVASTISSLGVRMPHGRDLVADGVGGAPWGFTPLPVLVLTVVLFVVFVITFYKGMLLPCMKLRLELDSLFASGEIDPSLKEVVESLGIQEMAANNVSIWNCTTALWDWIPPRGVDPNDPWSTAKDYWEVNSLIAFILMTVLVISFTILDMLFLVAMAVYMQMYRHRLPHSIGITHFLRKMSMLDVCITGVFVIILAGGIYEKSGVQLGRLEGLNYLLVAELCHYLCYFLVSMTARCDHPHGISNGEGAKPGYTRQDGEDGDSAKEYDETDSETDVE